MKTLIIRAVPASAGQPPRIEVVSPDLQTADAIALLERAKALLLSQNVPALDGEPPTIEQTSAAALAQRLMNGR